MQYSPITTHIAAIVERLGEHPRRAVYMVAKELHRLETAIENSTTESEIPQGQTGKIFSKRQNLTDLLEQMFYNEGVETKRNMEEIKMEKSMKERKQNVKSVIDRHMEQLPLNEMLMVLRFIYSLEYFG